MALLQAALPMYAIGNNGTGLIVSAEVITHEGAVPLKGGHSGWGRRARNTQACLSIRLILEMY